MLVGQKRSGKTSMVNRFGIAVEMNGRSSHFIESKVFMEMCRTNKADLFCIPDLIVVEGIDWLDDRTIRFGLCLAHERRKFNKDTILCIDSTTDLQAIEIIWKGHEYNVPKKCSY